MLSWPILTKVSFPVSRILCISVIASVYLEYTIVFLVVHWFVMTIWIHLATSSNTFNFCSNNKLYDSILFSIFGMVYVFTYVTLSEGRTFYKYLFFYCLLFLENTVANIVWTIAADSELKRSPYYKPVIYLNVIPFMLGIMFMVLYYKFFHPSTVYNGNRERRNMYIAQ